MNKWSKKWHLNPAKADIEMEMIGEEISGLFPDDKKMSAMLIFEEGFMNVATHAYEHTNRTIDNMPLDIQISIDNKTDDVILTFIDEGTEFDTTKYIPPEPKKGQIGGHGIRLMKELSKKMEYQRLNEKNILKIYF